jgi:hypothetical protein
MITQARHSNSRYIAADADDPTAYGPDGLLRDGYRIRVPVELMDSVLPLQRAGTVPRNISTGLTGEYKLSRFFYADGSRKADFVDGSRTPSRKGRRPVEPDENEFEGNDGMRDHRPGFRDAAAVRGVTDAGQAVKDAAYEEMCRYNENAWKSDHQRTADARQVTRPRVGERTGEAGWSGFRALERDTTMAFSMMTLVLVTVVLVVEVAWRPGDVWNNPLRSRT